MHLQSILQPGSSFHKPNVMDHMFWSCLVGWDWVSLEVLLQRDTLCAATCTWIGILSADVLPVQYYIPSSKNTQRS